MGLVSTSGTCFKKINRFEEDFFEVGYWTNNLPVNPGDFWNEDLMPHDHFWTQAPFGYSSQTLNITEGNLINQTCQNLEVVDDIIESSDSQAFEKVFQDAIPQMVDILK